MIIISSLKLPTRVSDNVQPVPDFVVSRADETSSESPAAETAPTPDNDAVAVTVLKNVVHVVGDDVEKPSVDNGDVTDEPIGNRKMQLNPCCKACKMLVIRTATCDI